MDNGRLRQRPGIHATKLQVDHEGREEIAILVLQAPGPKQIKVELDSVASLVWRCCDGSQSGQEIADTFAHHYPDTPTVKTDVLDTLTNLLEQGFLLIDGGEAAKESKNTTLRQLEPTVELLWHLEQIRGFLFGVMRPENARSFSTNLDFMLGADKLNEAKEQDFDASPQDVETKVLTYTGAMDSPSFYHHITSAADELAKLLPEVNSKLRPSGNAVYLPGSYMGWHSNHSVSDGRVYCSWADKDHCSFFRYEDPQTGEIQTHWEKPGWNLKSFTIPPDPFRFWHCIGSSCIRLSLGFKYALPEINALGSVENQSES